MYKHGRTLTEVNEMLPWEKEIYAILARQEKEKELQREIENGNGI